MDSFTLAAVPWRTHNNGFGWPAKPAHKVRNKIENFDGHPAAMSLAGRAAQRGLADRGDVAGADGTWSDDVQANKGVGIRWRREAEEVA
jgi:hypothetical protein